MGDERFGARFALGVLATWRVTHLLAEEDGPGDLVVRLRSRAGNGWQGRLMDCFYCLSVWTAMPFALAVARRGRDTPVAVLALSGAASPSSGPGRRPLERQSTGPTPQRTPPSAPAGQAVTFVR